MVCTGNNDAMPKRKLNQDKVRTGVSFDRKVLEWVDRQAKVNDRDRSWMVNELLLIAKEIIDGSEEKNE